MVSYWDREENIYKYKLYGIIISKGTEEVQDKEDLCPLEDQEPPKEKDKGQSIHSSLRNKKKSTRTGKSNILKKIRKYQKKKETDKASRVTLVLWDVPENDGTLGDLLSLEKEEA
ncbi:hypothetical protein JRQ81_017306 [Phrynocephalus forsythii]|uniref:Uncharacterized protein n=1 Tax=Phrynocephalus forsythii TaxID=171643 RepID=A0A9Q0XQ30_9SAUR|nr:hypothetical protein JRQ81_017306 [Phrynocephalus forsythii]